MSKLNTQSGNHKMDSKDREIIRELQADGRMSNQELAAKVNLSPSPCLRRLRNLENEGINFFIPSGKRISLNI